MLLLLAMFPHSAVSSSWLCGNVTAHRGGRLIGHAIFQISAQQRNLGLLKLLEHQGYANLAVVINRAELSEWTIAVIQSRSDCKTAEIAVIFRNIVAHPKKNVVSKPPII